MRRLVVACLLCGALLIPASAQGAFHDMRVTEVKPDAADGDFVELQMFSPGQNFISGHWLTVYGVDGGLDGSINFMTNVPNGENQRTVLIGETSAPGNPDFIEGLNVNAAGGAACYLDTFPLGGIDCVSWGTYDGTPAPPSPTATNAFPAGIPVGQSIERKISGGSCPTALDASDDTNNSANDVVLQTTPTPRNNSVAPTETPCVQPAAPGPKKKKCKKRKKKRSAAAAKKKKKCKKKKKK
jgi:hypothetical protein